MHNPSKYRIWLRHQKTSLFVTVLITAAVAMSAAPAYLDPTFGDGGKVILPFTSPGPFPGTVYENSTSARDVAIQADGKIVIVGTSLGAPARIFVVRYNADGSLDATFGNGGKIITNFDFSSMATGIAIQPDGSIVVAGFHYRPTLSTEEWVVVRIDTNGAYDNSFGVGGLLRLQMGGGADDILVQPDGKIVLVGGSSNGSVIARLNSNGSFDASFDGDGIAFIPGSASNVALQQDDKILVAGTTGSHSMLARFNPTGSLDATLDGDGVALTSVGSYWGGSYNGVAVQPDGKIVAMGSASEVWDEEPSYGVATLVRYHPTGALDESFDSDGIVKTVYSAFQSLVIQSNGKIVAGGVTGWGSSLHRYNANGSHDDSRNDRFGYSSYFQVLAMQPDGKVVAAGGAYTVQYDTSADILVARYLMDAISGVTLSGRVTTANGRGLGNAVITMVDSQGVRRTATTSTFGYYSFKEIPGDTYNIVVRSKRHQFLPRSIFAGEDLSGIDFISLN